jgi:hypothetical protein
MNHPRIRRPGNALLWLALVLIPIGFLVISSIHLGVGASPTALSVPATQSPTTEGPPINWDKPLGGATEVTSVPDAATHLNFAPIAPRLALRPLKIMVSGGEAVAWVYQDAAMGRFILIESKSSFTQGQLEALAVCDHQAGCEGQWTLAKIRNGTTALLIVGGRTTGLMWLHSGVTFDVDGPSASFTVDMAKSVANGI